MQKVERVKLQKNLKEFNLINRERKQSYNINKEVGAINAKAKVRFSQNDKDKNKINNNNNFNGILDIFELG